MKAIKDKPVAAAPVKRAKRATTQPFTSLDDLAAQRVKASAVLQIGTVADVWDADDEHRGQVTITGGYDSYRIMTSHGPFSDEQGLFDVRMGYRACEKGGNDGFYPAYSLSPVGKKYGHLKLVGSAA